MRILAIPLLASALALTSACASTATGLGPGPGAGPPPNIIVVFTDDQGYGDLACYGHPTIRTPNLDQLAAEGMKLTQFYVASSVCSPSRAALLTGCYPKRVGMHQHVIFPDYDYGLHTDAVTIADLLGDQGYATGAFGKWHLGHRPGLLPLDQGFDRWLGVPYSNDMAQLHRRPGNGYRYRLPLIRDREVIEWEPDQRLLTRRYTEAAVAFIEEHRDQPFFVYLPHTMPHVPLYASEEFFGGSARGLYGDVIEEIDWSVGELMAALERNGLAEDTLLLFTSDNGPWLSYGLRGGSAGPLRGGKGGTWEGGHRVPCVLRYPAMVPPGSVSQEVVTTMDLLPTIAGLAGVELPAGYAVDGDDVAGVLAGGALAEERPYLYYTPRGELAGVRRGQWKLLLGPGELFDLEQDVGETKDRAQEFPELVAELRQLAAQMDAEITAAAQPVRVVEELLFDPRRPEEEAAGPG